MADADGAKNLFRGQTLTATDRSGLVLDATDPPTLTRASVIVPQSVWAEIDLNIAALTTQRDLMGPHRTYQQTSDDRPIDRHGAIGTLQTPDAFRQLSVRPGWVDAWIRILYQK